jgi:hypothetical protein
MELKDIASVSGKGGLFRVVKPSKSGMILESLDNKKSKIIVGINNQVALLDEISIYTLDAEGSRPLKEVLNKINEEFGDDPGIDSKSDPTELKAFLSHILPEHDPDRVYPSDIKKLVSWYKILLREAPDLLTEKPGNEEAAGDNEG